MPRRIETADIVAEERGVDAIMGNRRKPGDVMLGIKHDINDGGNPVEMIALADLHIGDRNCNMKIIRNLIDSVLNNQNRYAVLLGDLMNTAIAGSKSDSYSETLTPQEQLDKCVELLNPIKDKILAVVPGNHEERITRQVGVDMPLILARELGLDSVYNAESALLFIQFGNNRNGHKMTYSVYLNHGHGGGRRPGGKLNSLQDYGLIVDADCYIVGHTHMPATYKSSRYAVQANKFQAVLKEQLFVNTASALSYGGYGKRGGYQPASNSYPVITFSGREHKMTVTL